MENYKDKISWMAIGVFTLLFGSNLYAQKPVVAILAWDEKAKESGDAGEIQIIQLGKPVPDLAVRIKIEGTASDGLDYRCFSDTWKIDKLKSFKILPIDDNLLEGDETVKVSLVESPDYTIEELHKSAKVTIQDASLPDVQFENPSSTGKEATENVELKIKLSKPSNKDVELDYTVQGVMAEYGIDFRLKSGTLVIPAGKPVFLIST